MKLAFDNDERNPFVDVVLRSHPGDWNRVDRSIDARDEMLEFAIGTAAGDRDAGLASYFLTGLELLELVRWCADCHFGAGQKASAMLDFASGYGRLTRFLVHSGVADELHVSDILVDAMEFQERTFGVRTIRSATSPADLTLDRSYDLITVASLFTHLPDRTFRAWLGRLVSSLAPGGVLIFSVHDESLANLTLGDSLHFVPASESRSLDTSDYGSTWVSEAYVRNSVASVDPELRVARLPRALSAFQDVFVVGRTLDAAAMERRETIHSHFETCSTNAQRVTVRGWATQSDGPVARVELRLDGEVIATLHELGHRPDVQKVFGPSSAVQSDWTFDLPATAIRSFHNQVVSVVVVGRGGVRRTVFIGTVQMAKAIAFEWAIKGLISSHQTIEERVRNLLSQSEEHRATEELLHSRLTELTGTIDWMRASRFWKIHDWWFRLKASLKKRVTSDE